MPILLPLALGGLALGTLALGIRRGFPLLAGEPSDVARAHARAVTALRETRQRLRRLARAHGVRHREALERVHPAYLELAERLLRWEQLPIEEQPAPSLLEKVRTATSTERGTRVLTQQAIVFAAGESWTGGRESLVSWVEGGWLEASFEGALEGVRLYAAVAPPDDVSDEDRARATAEVQKVTQALGAAAERLERHLNELGALTSRATVQLEYLEARFFDEGQAEPRERFVRLTALVEELAGHLSTLER